MFQTFVICPKYIQVNMVKNTKKVKRLTILNSSLRFSPCSPKFVKKITKVWNI